MSKKEVYIDSLIMLIELVKDFDLIMMSENWYTNKYGVTIDEFCRNSN